MLITVRNGHWIRRTRRGVIDAWTEREFNFMVDVAMKRKIRRNSERVEKAAFIIGDFIVILALLIACLGTAQAQDIPQKFQITETPGGVRVTGSTGRIDVEMLEPNLLRIDVQPGGKISPRTLVMDPGLKDVPFTGAVVREDGEATVIRSQRMSVSVTRSSPLKISVFDASGKEVIEQIDPIDRASSHDAIFLHLPGENLYGMKGLDRRGNGASLLRNNGAEVKAGGQGGAGAPWFFTTRYGVLIDSNGGDFDTRDDQVEFSGGSRDDCEYFVAVGSPTEVMAALATLTGRPPLPPKWSLGFINSQWGATEVETKQIVDTYRAKHIPIDAFIFDFDWKAWGEDNYGEWRWNSTSSAENPNPEKFPDGASGEFAKQLRSEGIKLGGILKPRILLYKKGSTSEMHEAAAYAQAHGLWYPDEPMSTDYFTGRPTRDLDFSKAETRAWYWKHLAPAFDAGITGWWSDEADNAGMNGGGIFDFDNFQFLNMGRALYDGQRGHSNVRVWSINRNYYLGAQRYGYAEWSGDIQTGFQSMQYQRMRMLATLDLGEPHWSMDSGGFFGHPTSENYARWIEFATFVPIDRVHGYIDEKRQPWVYGSVAEAAATKAIRLRYELLPYIYSYERVATETGVGIVRPLFWEFPDDPKLADEGSSWMFGEALLVSPVVTSGESEHKVYLPAGVWYDYFRGTRFEGRQTISYKVDSQTWQDIPLFVRSGSIIASQASQDYVDQHPADEVTLDIFPAAHPAQFVYYDDDGETYAYEQGTYYRQTISASRGADDSTHLQFDRPTGSFHSALRSYVARVHGIAANAVVLDGTALARSDGGSTPAEGQWVTGRDRFGLFTSIRIRADRISSLILR